MNKFNLRFWGEILPGHDPSRVRQRFGKLFGIEDPERLEKFFSGESILLRRNLDRKVAAEYYAKLHKLGVEAELVKLTVDAPRPAAPKDKPRDSRQAGQEEHTRRKAESAQRKKTEADKRQRVADEKAARKKAEQSERRRLAEEKAARERAENEERRLREAEERAKREAEEAERQRLAEKQECARKAAAQKKAQEQERKRLADEEAARKRAQEQERKRMAAAERARLKAEEAAQKRAEAQERKRIAAEEAARRKAEEQERKRRAAAERARLKAEEAERKRREAEEAARQKAIEEQRQRKAAEAAERQKAAQEEQRRAQAEEAARRQAERRKKQEAEKARLKAEREAAAEKKRELAEQARRESAKKAAAEAQRRREEKSKADEQAARLRAEREEKKRRQAEEAVRLKEEERQRREEALARARAEQAEQVAQRQAMEAQAIARGAEALARQPSIKSVTKGVKSSLAVPTRPRSSAETWRKRQAGEPNLYSLQAFRNTSEVRERSQRAGRHMMRAARFAAIAVALLLIVGGGYLSLAPAEPISGPEALAVNPGGGPALLTRHHLLLHDRSGSGVQTLKAGEFGLTAFAPPLAFAKRNLFYTRGLPEGQKIPGNEWPLLRCDVESMLCETVVQPDHRIDALAAHPLSGQLFIADGQSGELIKYDSQGRLLARANTPISDQPGIRLDSGLLLMNSATGPAIGVYRYEDENFGQQLDEVLLLPPAAVHTGQSRVGNFLGTGQSWWVELYNPEDDSGDLFRFDREWQFQEEVLLPPDRQPDLMADWNGKLLVGDKRSPELQRFSAEGLSEAPLASSLLKELIQDRQNREQLWQFAWQNALLLCALLAVTTLIAAIYQRMRSMVYRSSRERGAPPIDELADSIRWIDPVEERDKILKRRTNIYLVLCAVVVAVAVAFAAQPIALLTIIIALAGPALALALLRREPIGHIGTEERQLILVDHRNVYHLGSDARIQYWRAFLLIDDVVVFTGTAALPAFSREQLQAMVYPLRDAGVRVDRTTIIIKLLQSRHALAVAILLTLFTSTTALLMAALALI